MQGALLALMAFVLSGPHAAASHTGVMRALGTAARHGERLGLAPAGAGLPACAIGSERIGGHFPTGTDDADDATAGDTTVFVAEGDGGRLSSDAADICLDSAGFRWERGPRLARRATREVATPAVIGCALVFGSRPAPPGGAADPRPWSCEESGRHVYNTWYRVSRTPEIEPGRLHPQAHAVTEVDDAAEVGGSTSWTSDAPRSAFGTIGLDHPLLPSPAGVVVPPQGRALSPRENESDLLSRPIAPPERPPRARADQSA
jgi:hypothetical protein